MRVQKLPNNANLAKILAAIACDPAGAKIMAAKGEVGFFYLRDLSCGAANILKQDALAIGAELATHKGTANCAVERADALLIANNSQLKRLAEKEKSQPFELKEIASELEIFANLPSRDFKSDRAQIMGILNINEDSFNAASRVSAEKIVDRAEKMINDGAAILDIGAVSSRPGSESVSAEVELQRLKPAIDALYSAKICDRAKLSLDSFEPIAINYALDRGFTIINDITGGENNAVLSLAARYNAAIVLTHKKGEPKNMQENPRYENVALEVAEFFAKRIAKARKSGVSEIILDCGVGFGKSAADNLRLINAHADFARFGYPLLIGASRKSLIASDLITPAAPVAERLGGTIALHLRAAELGAKIVRCHDVFEHFQAFLAFYALKDHEI
ncbi:MAG: dihydropteroate synthase [Helicobacteraceae bacterium]|jgi:dihydropteroate synthase|nr:dihydropteroate synthase [Helicobacteraceae bacterium]